MISKLLTNFCSLAEKSNTKFFSIKSLFLALLCIGSLSIQAQVSSYSWTGTGVGQSYTNLPATNEISWTGPVPTPSATQSWDDHIAATAPIGFNFNFNGKVYSNVNISPNGFITFGTVKPATSNYAPVASTEAYEGAISAYGINLVNANISIRYLTTGTAPTRIFTVEFIAYRSGVINGVINTQIVLNESAVGNPKAGVIEMLYNNTTASSSVVGRNGQIGLRGETNNDFRVLKSTVVTNWPTVFPSGSFTIGNSNANTVITRSGAWMTNITKFTWTPPVCYAPRLITTVANSITNSSANFGWTAPTGSSPTSYDYFVSTTAPTDMNNPTGGFPNATNPATFTTTAVTNGTATGLTGGQLYYIYVRSNCGTPGGWSVGTFRTLCDPIFPYTQPFTTVTVPGIDACDGKQTFSSGATSALGTWVSSDASAPNAWGFVNRHLRITVNAGNDNEAWFYTRGVSMIAGNSYRISYRYGASATFAYTEQQLSLWYGSLPYSGQMTTQIANHPNLKGGPYTNVINFIAPSTGTFYFGFLDESIDGNETTLLDDISINNTTCFAPTLAAATGITSGSATINWNALATPPSGGYQYYVSNSATPPTSTTVISGSTASAVTSATVGGLIQSTTYYFWVRSSCGGGDFSNWQAVPVPGPGTFTTLMGAAAPTCTPSGATFAQDPNGITNVTITNLNNTTGIEPNNYGDYTYLTPAYVGTGTTVPFSITYRTGFTYDTKIWIDWNNDGDFLDLGEDVYTGTSTAANPAVLTGTFNVTGSLGAHRMRIGGIDSPAFLGGALTPCRAGQYQSFEDYTLWVTSPSPVVTLSTYTATTCSNACVTINLTSPLADYNSYSWSPSAGVTQAGSVFTFCPTATTTYTLNAYNSVNFHYGTKTVTITVTQAPAILTASPATSTVCQTAGPAAALTASGGSVAGVTIYTENFNGSAPGWVTTNSTSGGIDAAAESQAAWGLFPDGYAPFFANLSSNDASQFFFTESDAPGNGSTTATTATSPAINLTGYTTASLSFWQFYKHFNGPEGGQLLVSTTTSTGPWTSIATYGAASDVGSETAWSNAVVDLTSYALANNTIYLQFQYDATWDWGWGIDNFVITGSGPSTITWAPTTGLYTSATTIPANAYTGGPATTVYALPNTTQTYTATASAFGCTAVAAAVTVNVTPQSAGTITTPNQSVCSGNAAVPIVTTGTIGTIQGWEWATDAAFTVPNFIPGSAGLSTLTPALIGNITSTRYYRIVVAAGACTPVKSNPGHRILIDSTTWQMPGPAWTNGTPNSTLQVIFAAPYTASGNLNACSVVVTATAGTVTIPTAFTLTVQNGVTVDPASNLVFQNNASLVQVNNTTNTGDIQYYRNTTPMRPFDYTYWSSPVDAQILAKLSPLTLSDKYFYFNTTTYQWTNPATAPGVTPMDVGRGYIIRAPQGHPTGTTFNTHFGYDGVSHGGGVPNNGDYVVSIGLNATPGNNLNCIGNPYPSAISADLFMLNAANAAALGAGGTTMYFWTHNSAINNLQYNNLDYASYNYTGGVGVGSLAGTAPCAGCNTTAPTGNIAAGQAFMIRVQAAGSVTFKNSMRLTGLNNQFWRMDNQANPVEALEKNRLWLELKNDEGAYKQTLVGYVQNATNGLDAGFDGEVLEAGNPVSLYSILDNSKLSIQGRALPFDNNDIVPLGYKTTIAGTYQINLIDFDGFFPDQDVYLEDKLLSVFHNLKQDSYSFTTESGTFDNRFVLRYGNSVLSTTTPSFDENAVVVYKNSGTIYIETSNIIMKSVQLYDIRGRKIYDKQSINNNKTEISNLNAAQEVLLVHITSADNVTVTKKIVF